MIKYFSPLPVFSLFLCALLLGACERRQDEQAEFIDLAADALCDREPGCSVNADGFSVSVLIGPGPRALRPFPVHIRLPDRIPVTEIWVEFVMVGMQMGSNRYRLVRESNGHWRAQVTLPVCMSGRSDWLAEFELLADGRRLHIDVPFGLEK